jgi:hypothetical protein
MRPDRHDCSKYREHNEHRREQEENGRNPRRMSRSLKTARDATAAHDAEGNLPPHDPGGEGIIADEPTFQKPLTPSVSGYRNEFFWHSNEA